MSDDVRTKVTTADMVTAKLTVERIHRELQEGYTVEKDLLAELINTLICFLDATITAVDKENITINGEEV
jgi:hypothetical protein